MMSEALLFAEYLEHRNCADGVLRRLWVSKLSHSEQTKVSEWAEIDKCVLIAYYHVRMKYVVQPLVKAIANLHNSILTFQRACIGLPQLSVYSYQSMRIRTRPKAKL